MTASGFNKGSNPPTRPLVCKNSPPPPPADSISLILVTPPGAAPQHTLWNIQANSNLPAAGTFTLTTTIPASITFSGPIAMGIPQQYGYKWGGAPASWSATLTVHFNDGTVLAQTVPY